jgi:UDP-N-acetylmuramate--alanine ligase
MRPDPDVDTPEASALGRVHFIGIGGAGMSGIARIALSRGLTVSGSDAKDSRGLSALRALGATIRVGHSADAVADVDTVVVSSAVRETNPELVAARAAGARVLHRAQALVSVMAGRRGVAVAGTHGKTTTTGMITVALQHCGVDPSFAIGGELTESGANAHDGTGDVFVAEADESDGSFLLYSPQVAVITNVEPDHLDHYGTAQAVEQAFDAFCDRVSPGGLIVVCLDDPGARRVAERARSRRAADGVRLVGYGMAPDADMLVEPVAGDVPGTEGDVSGIKGQDYLITGAEHRVSLRLRVSGWHNALNATAAWAAATGLGLDPDLVAEGLSTFGGTRRRFELRGQAGGVRVIDDYAHHPTEVAAALAAARELVGDGRVVVVFQPHLFSRTRIFAQQFGAALGSADEVVVMDVFAAREDPEPGVTGELIAAAVPLPRDQVTFVPSWSAVADEVVSRCRPGDLVLTLGAGDVTMLGPEVLHQLSSTRPGDESPAPQAWGRS